MNYRHAYHAGGVADVFKHLVLIALLAHCKQKESGFLALDTHAGIGLYDLTGPEASKTGEYRDGIAKLQGVGLSSPLLTAYRAEIDRLNLDGGLRFYPGSPSLIARALRSQDRGIACELHPEDAALLRQALHSFPRIGVHHRDGYEALGAFLPPPEKRALVLMDPPFENPSEFDAIAKAMRRTYERFAQGIYALWYPIKERPAVWRFHEAMEASGIARQVAIEFLSQDESDSRQLNGSGVLIINPPYRWEETLMPALEELCELLTDDGKVTISQIAP